MRVRSLLGLVLVFVSGCGSEKLAPVSGTVTLDGKPLAGATVSFQPTAEREGIEAPLGSTGKTNDKGEYTLQTITGKPGAVVGKHKVAISRHAQQVGDSDARAPRGGWPLKDQVPTQYNEQTTLTYDVPAGGSDKADFALKSR